MAGTGQKIVRQIIKTAKAPSPLGAYSQAVKVGNTLYISGNIGIVPSTMKFAGNEIKEQTTQALKNIQVVLEEAGMTFSNVVKTTVLLDNIDDFAKANEIYASFFTPPYPARAAYQVAKLPKGAKIEIEAIAVKHDEEA